MAQIKPIPFPYQMTDYSSSSHITFTFDDSSKGGSARTTRTLDCGSYWQLQTEAIRKVRDLISDCINGGICLEEKETKYDAGNSPMSGFMGMGMMGIGGPQPSAGNSNVQPPAGSWKCECGEVNAGKFCANCGKPRPV